MSTLIAVYTSEDCVGRCAAKCYEATTPECDCICPVANHGVGLGKAVANTRENAETWNDRHVHELGKRTTRVLPDVQIRWVGVSI